ncbi:unnamed protein product [Eruca vesicaria subsp. sativa]|uniref:BHLH domain-containing protein n=1 Tax=Eruca vesicaria subsp. sativa TaxID=29727 RepID=A0ABC8KLN9_ERUVS|nr:unnamed protein product [Eruca vesicaria subsp. sativa]
MDVFVDGELESLLWMFNADQCSSSEEDRPRDEILSFSSLYNDHLHDHHQNNVLSSDDHHALFDMFPPGATHGGNLPTMFDSGDQNYLQETATRKRKPLQELVKAKKKQRVNPQNNSVDTNWRNGQSIINNSVDEKSSVTSVRGKTRATKGQATDPQSLYARKRRERINERLRELQNLIPNGTKIDISTMLEEAVNYVKFLQLQIKLLSSDDLWMYAPLAYNGLDIGFDHNLLSQLM